ncbi:hypothetical protein Dda_7009 [Drechslerella dactyloides]|uniref:Uncharacterized protein n=1 Tax=Drechslerella dactyloides TaxID=74499 RepID=A0AAD6IU63_DREDA|nr:hypothetical protein Dda_7009 [Drechslerella dactyloides]
MVDVLPEIWQSASHLPIFEKDEGVKWVGLVTKFRDNDQVSAIAETPRLKSVLEASRLSGGEEVKEFEALETPVVGAQTGEVALISTNWKSELLS